MIQKRRIRSSKHISREPELPWRRGSPDFFGKPWKRVLRKKPSRILLKTLPEIRKLALERVLAALTSLGASETRINREDWIAYAERQEASPAVRAWFEKHERQKKLKAHLGKERYNKLAGVLWKHLKFQKTAGIKRCSTIITIADEIIESMGN